MRSELVSVVMATYNMGQYVAQAVESVLSQDYSPLELIVVDDGSTDRTPDILRQFALHPAVRLLREANAGQTVAKNVGLAHASGEYVGFCDADNAWMPNKIARQLPLFDAAGRVGVVYGDILLMDGDGRELPTRQVKRYDGRITKQLLIDNFVTFNTALVRRHAIDAVGGFNSRLHMAIDYDLWLRISTKYEFRYLPQPLARYRLWGGQMSHNLEGRFASAFALLEAFLEDYPGSVTFWERHRAWAHSLVSRARWRSSNGQHSAAWADIAAALRHRPHDRRAWRSCVRLALNQIRSCRIPTRTDPRAVPREKR